MTTARAIVLARGLGTRMRAPDDDASLTKDQCRAADAGLKAMFPIAGRPFIDHVLNAVADAGIRHVALVVAPDHGDVEHHYRVRAPPSRLTVDFVVQAEPLGTANAVLAAERWAADDPFLVMNADTLYTAAVLKDLAALNEPGLAAFERAELVASSNIPEARVQAFALLEVDDDGYLAAIVEKPAPEVFARVGGCVFVSMNCWRFDRRIFDACRSAPRSPRGEFELPSAVNLAMQRGVGFKVLRARGQVLDLSNRGDAAEVARRIGAVIPAP